MQHRIRVTLAAAIAGAAVLSVPTSAQISIGGDPTSFSQRVQPDFATETMEFVDVAALKVEDAVKTEPGPFRFGATLGVDISPDTHGTWEVLEGGDLLWRLRIESPGSIHTSVVFDRYWVPPGATMHLYSDDQQLVLGGYTNANHDPSGMFGIQPVPGEALTIEYRQPANAHQHADLHIHQVIHAYHDIMGLKSGGGGSSGSCNVNVACAAGNPWGDQINASARLCMGGGLCSGALINNTNQDGRQFFLTANHCSNGAPGSWVFQFNYEGNNCGSSSAPNGPNWHSVSGSTKRASSGGSDFYLTEINSNIPANFNAVYAGWERNGANFPNSFGIHHPGGDIKKICEDDHAASKTSWGGAQVWHVAKWELGVTEGGSSGSPLFNDHGQIVGQLYGGQAACGFLFNDYYGRLDTSWNLGAKAWLDPGNTGATSIDAYDPANPPQTNPEIYCTSKLTSAFTLPTIGWTGEPKFSTNNFNVTLANAVGNKTGIAFWGESGRNNLPFLGGTLCVQPPTVRSMPFLINAGGAHSLSFPIGVFDIGKTYNFQYWFRDPLQPDGTGVGLSDGLEATIEP